MPLRIAMLSIHSSPLGPLGTRDTGGMSVYVRELARWLGYLGHRVDIFTYIRADDTDTVDLYPNVRLIQLAPSGAAQISKEQLPLRLTSVFNALETYRLSHALTYDLIHSHYWLSGVVGTMAQQIWQCPHVTMFHTLGMVKNSTSSGENESDLRVTHERQLVEAADRIVVPAAREREHLTRLYHAQASKIEIIPCGVNLDLFQPGNRQACRRQLGIPQNSKIALFVGRFAPLKGIDALLGAVADLKKKMPDIHLVVVGGDGPEAASTRQLADLAGKLGIQDRVSFAGSIEQTALPAYYSACDLLVVSSHYESFGLVVLEALACGTPVVATPVGDVENIILQDVNGVIIDNPSRSEIARGIARVLDKSLGREEKKKKIRDSVVRCGWERIAVAVARTYGELITARKNMPPVCRNAGYQPFPN